MYVHIKVAFAKGITKSATSAHQHHNLKFSHIHKYCS